MGLRFRKSIGFGYGFRINISKVRNNGKEEKYESEILRI